MSVSTNQFSFAGGEVAIKFPTGAALKAVSLAIGDVSMQPTSDFTPIRVVANIAIEETGKSGVYLTDLPQKVEFTVRYRPSDQAAARGKPLVLAFWDGSTWVRLTAAKHGFNLTADSDPRNGGSATISITKWADPPIAWGT